MPASSNYCGNADKGQDQNKSMTTSQATDKAMAAPILGQDKALRLLARARTGGRLAHAYLFTGPEGVGKSTLARNLATSLLCHHPDASQDVQTEQATGCGLCTSCLQMQSGSHPDFLLIEPDGQGIKIDSIRLLKQTLGYPPLEGALRVVLLKEVHTMRREAANSLLKILEEPPPGNLLLLTSADEAGLLPTIYSRCQRIALKALPLELAREVILQHKPDLSRADCLALAELSGGCPGQALRMEEENILPLYQDLLAALLYQGRQETEQVQAALSLAGRLNEHREMSGHILHRLRILCTNALAMRLCGQASGSHDQTDRTSQTAQTIQATRERWNTEQLSAKLASITKAEQALHRNCNPTLVFEVLLLQLFDCLPFVSPDT